MDNWITAVLREPLLAAPDPLVVDLGYGATPVTAVELAARLARVRSDVRVLGLELDPERVAAARPAADPPRLDFARGGFELAGTRPALVRAANVLRQYDEPAAARAWDELRARLASGGLIVEGTCDELGRLGAWVLLSADGPRTLTLACRIGTLERPATFAERLPKALIHHNVPGQAIHRFLLDLDTAWDAAAPVAPFGPRQRWLAACRAVVADWPVDARRARYGEITVDWSAVAP
jgi:hypothetical protein